MIKGEEDSMNRKITLNSNVTSNLLVKNGFKQSYGGKFYICKKIYNDIIILKFEIDLDEKEIIYDVIDRNTQTTYYPFWNNVNGENNLVAVEVIKNFNKYIEELQEKRILKRRKKNVKRSQKY